MNPTERLAQKLWEMFDNGNAVADEIEEYLEPDEFAELVRLAPAERFILDE